MPYLQELYLNGGITAFVVMLLKFERVFGFLTDIFYLAVQHQSTKDEKVSSCTGGANLYPPWNPLSN